MSKVSSSKTATRRRFLLSASATAAAAAVAAPAVQAQQGPIAMRFQSTWPSKDIFHEYALDFGKKINDMTGGDLKIEVLPAGAVVPAFQLLDAVSKGVLDGGHGVLVYHYGKQNALALWRTGLHVHVDCRDLAPQQLAGMLVLYALYEPAIYRFVGEDRDQNVFCRPWYRCSGAVDLAAATVNAILETGDFERRWDSLVTNDDRRYAGLNLQSLGELGTVEWRQLKTTHDTARVVNWINIALGFKAAAYSIPASNITIVEDVRRMGANAYLAMYFPHQVTSLLAHSGLDVEVEELGMPVALDLMKSGTGAPWERAKLEKKPFKPAISYIEGRMKTAQAYEVVPKAAIDPTHATIMQQYQALYGGIDAPGATVGEWLTPTFVPHVPQQGVPNLGRAAATRRAAEAAAGARAAPLNVEEAYFARNNDVRGDNAR